MAVRNNNEVEKKLWDTADELRANSKLKSSEFSVPVLGLIFLRCADQKFSDAESKLRGKIVGRGPFLFCHSFLLARSRYWKP